MAYTSGADWAFPTDLPVPGSYQDEIDPQIKREAPEESKPIPTPIYNSAQDAPSNANASSNPPPQQRRRHYPPRTCRICLETVLPTFHQAPAPTIGSFNSFTSTEPRVTYETEGGGRLLRPCKCKGTQKYVHEACLSAWRLADPLRKRNYWECPTCRYRYHLERLTWGSRISSTPAQVVLTIAIFVATIFLLGFVADPIINLYLDPYGTVTSGGGPTTSIFDLEEPVTWAEHFAKGLASLGLLGFAKFMLSLSPFQFFNVRGTFGSGRGGLAGTGRDRMRDISWIAVAIGVGTVVYAVWKGVRAWSRRTLEKAGERVMDVPVDVGGEEDDDEED